MDRINKPLIIRLIGLLILVIMTWVVFQRYQLSMVKGESMQPALDDQELVLIHKQRSPQRYDLIAFEQEDKLLVKRVIGMPGDTYIRSGNRLLLADTKTAAEFSFTITLMDELAAELPKSGQLKEGEYFVLGDALLVSRDSRAFGLVLETSLWGVVTPLL
ncbi:MULTISPECIES: signal peptidase I [unclassified Enterococcus]|uniref:signal peptidase I n=1 Tax=unclassified Enterococcus TaxID=2608891 RepID=UPI001904679F|nr:MULTISPECIES: signal peptidase I [unclassified Enterococcus]MBK0039225.1 signal peptidase I [Enterococcus sp. S52]MBK0071873.1 signal peptidase I [Enterococcus sp. S53]MBK0142465.1 signal peptidase I [Enterococcus sp. S76]MBK0146160.1 signal peptidase I [Enterococcus sp. S77]